MGQSRTFSGLVFNADINYANSVSTQLINCCYITTLLQN